MNIAARLVNVPLLIGGVLIAAGLGLNLSGGDHSPTGNWLGIGNQFGLLLLIAAGALNTSLRRTRSTLAFAALALIVPTSIVALLRLLY